MLFIFILIIFITVIILLLLNNSNNTMDNKKQAKITKTKETVEDKINSECKKIKYCKVNNMDRYISYYKNNNTLSFEDIVTKVNLNLDYSFYTHTEKTPFLNKEYILVNKYLYLGEDYVPDNLEDIPTDFARSGMKLVNIAKEAFVSMAKKARDDGFPVIAMSSYRSYKYQVNLYNRYVTNDGVESADTYSARPGYSEHQTGLCVDVYDGKIDFNNFEQSDSFKWMQENAYKYGFILRFPKEYENITGYQYESWHYRYVGVDIATYIHKNNITFEEYYVRFIEPKYKS